MPTELDSYLDSLAADGALTDAERSQLAGILGKNEKVRNNAVNAHRERLAHADYTRKTQELARDRDRAASEVAAMNTQLSKALRDLEAGKTSNAQYRARLESIQEEYGIDLNDVLTGEHARATAPPAPPSSDDILRRLEQAENNYRFNPRVSARLQQSQIEYQKLFGNLEGYNVEDLLNYADENKIALMGDPKTGSLGAFERLYKIPEKRHELLVAKITADAEAKANADVQKRVDQMLAGNATGNRTTNDWGAPGSPVLSQNFRDRNSERISTRGEGETGDRREAPRPPAQSRSAAEQEVAGGGAGFAKAFLQRRAAGVPYGKAIP
jgi:hypothetical protein